ncbi:MAG: sugar transferase [Firmicutes bacterium]|nr:sugar transferase [Bacillota bacterium]
MYKKCIKRALDIVISFFALIILSPVFLIVSIKVRKKLGSPVFFTQDRPGLIDSKTGKEKIFKLYKFRSMTNETDENGELLPKEQRLTHFGKKLRATSLDELPELVNILKGDMSIVGPRPLLVKYLPLYSEEQRRRHLVRPGLTGLAQVNGRNELSWDEKFELDLKYVDNISFSMDLSIFFKTVMTVIKHEGIGKGDADVIAEFKGDGNE